jgi:RHH-type proline utilization regulon transcriptional repressor/proline dehydrogenase/delta 1-pyrroline-5-carboxylate dehydrogenase
MGDTFLERDVRSLGEELCRLAGRAPPSLFDPRGLRGRVLRRAMEDEELRTALFRFVDVLPAVESDADLARHFRNYLEPFAGRLPGPLGRLFALGGRTLAAPAVRRSVILLARQFVAEETPESLARAIGRISRIPAAVTLDAVGEAALSEGECETYRERYLRLLGWLAGRAAAGHPPVHISVKLSALSAHFDPLDYAGARRRVFGRLAPVVAKLKELGGAMTVDMEQHELKSLTLRLFRELVEFEGTDGWLPGLALQAYLPETERDLRELLDFAERRGRRIGVRLVKGAYWDTEVALALQRNWPVPVFREKAATDIQFERLTGLLFERRGIVHPAIGSHNPRSLAYAMAAARRYGLSTEDYEIQMLYGMAEPLRHAVAAMGANLRIYLPTGELLPGIAYLIRRLVENTANTSILRQTYVGEANMGELLVEPTTGDFEGMGVLSSLLNSPHPTPVWPGHPARPPAGAFHATQSAPGGLVPEGEGVRFLNTPLRDFSREQVRHNFAQSLAAVRSRLGEHYPLDIDGVPAGGSGWQASRNPARPDEILGLAAIAGIEHAQRAVDNARRAFPAWRDTPAAVRVGLCRRAAEIMELRRDELASWQVLEAGKNWREADADVAEAIDFLRYYALQMEDLQGWRPTVCFPGELNHLRYEPRGVAVVIPPWNFPLAILAGMAAAALVAGNVAILKPATPANLIAHGFRRILDEAGFPRGVCQLLPGSGATLGDFLVTHPQVHLIAFTGSRAVGLEILRKAHTPVPGQVHVKQVVCEMGGKNAVIVDEDADLDEAVQEILYSAFGYQGQKCSACSRLIAVGRVHDRIVERLAAVLDSYEYGPPENPAHVFGPLITAEARNKSLEYLEIGRREGNLAYSGRVPEQGFYCPPAIFTGIEPRHRLAREEIFGPVLAVLRAPSFEAALKLALDSDYALTGGVFTRLPAHLQLARENYRVGNLYLNRRITGARVGIQPFGGVKYSGTGVQAGGPDYLKQFLWSRVASENALRHGFVPGRE